MLYSQELLNYKTQKPLSRKSIKNIRDVMGAIFEFVAESQSSLNTATVLYNPAKGRKIPKDAGVKRREAISVQLQKLLYTQNSHKMYIAAMIFMFCGLRRGELIPLLWSDIDFENHLLSVNKSVIEQSNMFLVKKGAKTETSIRKIPIPPILMDILKRSVVNTDSKFVCPRVYTGHIHTPSSWGRAWEEYLSFINQCYLKEICGQVAFKKVENLLEITPHILRHTYCTILFNAGVDVLSAAKFLGHKSPQTTIKIYTHLQKEKVESAINSLNVYVEKNFMI